MADLTSASLAKRTYGDVWDRYVAKAFPKLQEQRDLTYPGEEWGNETRWQAIFEHLFVSAGVANWQYAVEIGGGGGKYTERVLLSNDLVKIWGFDVSQNFLDATSERLGNYANRLFLHRLDDQPDAILKLLQDAGIVRQVDALFSIDAMVHVDLQYLVAYWINAALVLRPGGHVIMTLADPTTQVGFEKLIRDIRKFYRFQGAVCPKFEYLSKQIVEHVLTNLGFDIEVLDHWAMRPDGPARDIHLIARLARPEHAKHFRAAIGS